MTPRTPLPATRPLPSTRAVAPSSLWREDIRINDLADQVGFEDANYLVKCFKEKYGVSPNKYAKM